MQVNCWVYESYGSKTEMIWWFPMSCGYPKPSKSWMTILVLKPVIFGYILPSLEAPMYSLAFFIILQETVLMELVHGTGTDIHVDVGCNKAPHYDPVPPQCTKIHLISSLENESIMFWLTILIQSWYPQNLQHKLVANLTMPGLGMRMALKATRRLPVPDHSRPRMTLSRASVFLPSTWQLDVSNSPGTKFTSGTANCFPNMTGWWCNNHLEKWWSSSMGRTIPYIMENKTCLKPPTRWCEAMWGILHIPIRAD